MHVRKYFLFTVNTAVYIDGPICSQAEMWFQTIVFVICLLSSVAYLVTSDGRPSNPWTQKSNKNITLPKVLVVLFHIFNVVAWLLLMNDKPLFCWVSRTSESIKAQTAASIIVAVVCGMCDSLVHSYCKQKPDSEEETPAPNTNKPGVPTPTPNSENKKNV